MRPNGAGSRPTKRSAGIASISEEAGIDYLSAVGDPLIVGSAEELAWDDEADLVVVGFGGAGAAAGLQARELGGEVIALDRFGGGGATAFSGGVFYAGGTRFQAEAGYADSADNMFAYLSQEESAVGPETLRRFCAGSNDDIEWLARHGVPFDATVWKDKTAYPPDGYFLYYSGNEKVPSYAAAAAPAPRGHRAVGAGFSGYAYFAALQAAALGAGVRLQPHSPVTRLVVDAAGRVLGVEARDIPAEKWPAHEAIYKKLNPMRGFAGVRHEKAVAKAAKFETRFTGRRLLRARRGVLLSAGGFVYNLQMIERHRPLFARVYKAIVRIGSMGDDGSGIELGQSVGGATRLMDEIFAGRSIVPPEGFLHGVLVDGEGRRFINEDAYTGFIGEKIGKLPRDGKAWLILDHTNYRAAVRQCLFPGKGLYMYTLPSLLNMLFGGARKARTLKALARKCRLDPIKLTASVTVNNAAAIGRIADPLGKARENSRPLRYPPYHAINMDLGNKFAATLVFTLGGLEVDETSGAAVRPDGSAIPGLYAAGRTAVGLCSKGYLSGMSLADTVFSGRRAARAILTDQ
jgi:3-oxo-5alpha-steroid 4-dehydrogenase